MSANGAPTITDIDGRGLRVVVIAAQWHTRIMDALVDGATRALTAAGVEDVTLIRVPGTFELSVAASRLAASRPDAIVCLGVVVRGGTPHFEYVCESVTVGLTQVSVATGIPVGFGVLTVDNEQQAIDRAGLPGSSEDKGAEAAQAAVYTALALSSFE
ncbi:6,7-dimethyl-8-ribityllumazine synthase [Rarobacter incanus]|uniref:6,7-dimethyl-8-ribityllumazine synthase n=1 Tax=Rarobacter incanus TaxID=153494 RepID=A0A542SM17_9MICO|nr:6,7-dimethyl-8-ribityllumazine synthase [Rarobacter incanus]TQK75662.1 6,7-dimethyl-8-ribityllumazine synthase [Rarobacter incanus]